MNDAEALNRILLHESPLVFGEVSGDLRPPMGKLAASEDSVVPLVRSAVVDGALGRLSGPYWWDGAALLCEVLGRISTEHAKQALLAILKTDSHIVEFDRVRAAAALELPAFRDPTLVSDLEACLSLPHAPIGAIEKAIEELGGSVPETPEAIIDRGREMDPEEAIRHFHSFEEAAKSWPADRRGGFYYFFGHKAETTAGSDGAAPYYAAALLANPGPNSAAWLSFPDEERFPDAARRLADRYPLPSEPPTSEPPAKTKRRRWWKIGGSR